MPVSLALILDLKDYRGRSSQPRTCATLRRKQPVDAWSKWVAARLPARSSSEIFIEEWNQKLLILTRG